MKNKKSKLLKLAILIGVLLLNIALPQQIAQASNLEINCDNSDSNDTCKITQGSTTQIFNVRDWAPGKTQVQTITIVNNDLNDSCKAGIKIDQITSQPEDFGKRIFSAMSEGSNLITGAIDAQNNASSNLNIVQLAQSGIINLGSIQPGETKTITWTTTFDPATPNQYQSAGIQFDAEFSFECDYKNPPQQNQNGLFARLLRWLRELIRQLGRNR